MKKIRINLVLFYRKVFSVNEIESTKQLQYIYWGFLFYLFYVFNRWGYTSDFLTVDSVKKLKHTCYNYFPNCGDYYFLKSLESGYSLTTLYGLLLTCITLSAIFALKKRWCLAHLLILIPFLWKFFVTVLLSYKVYIVFPIFFLPMSGIWLFSRQKLVSLQFCLCILYFTSALVKLHPSWILGSYFSSLTTGMAFVSEPMIPIITNFVIVFEILSPWLLLSSNAFLRKISVYLWILFHLYSSIYVGYRYPLLCIPMLISLFYIKDEPFRYSRVKFNFGLLMVGFILVSNIYIFSIGQSQKYTHRATKLGLLMFDANHQCYSSSKIHPLEGEPRKLEIIRSKGASGRCDPYHFWFKIKLSCQNLKEGERISWSFYSSLNSGPFYKIVDLEDICTTNYSHLYENEWINIPDESTPYIGYPSKNPIFLHWARKDDPFIYESPQVKLSPTQQYLAKYQSEIQYVWSILWFLTLSLQLARFIFRDRLLEVFRRR